MMDQFQAKFIEEANDLIATLEKTLLALEQSTGDKALVEKVFRVMHTLKGNSSMFGFEKMGAVTHHLETMYDFVREGKKTVTKELLTLTFTSLDHFKVLLADPQLTNPEASHTHQQIMHQIDELINAEEKASTEQTVSPAKAALKIAEPVSPLQTYYILFRPHADILVNGTNPLFLVDELCSLGTSKVIVHLQDIPSLEVFSLTKCYTYWEIYLSTLSDENAIRDVFIFVEDECDIEIKKIANGEWLSNEGFLEKISEYKKKQVLADVPQLQQYAVKAKVIEKKKTDSQTQQTVKEQVVSSIRVSSDKLDDLMNLVSELVTTQARLSLFAEQNTLPELISIAENVEKISRQLRDNTFSICLVPLDNILTRFHRLVRDLSAELKKDIILVTEGADTELDKSMIESLADPLLHILRNAADHGIENPEERIKKGKPAQAKILLKAYYSGTNVHIDILDDGAGINTQNIRKKAISKGLIPADAILSEEESINLIFLPGFSTAEKVTDVSGRGVGMDVVKRKIADLRGEVKVQSKVDVGTTITIKLPLTLSIIDGLLVQLDQTHYVIPLAVVHKCFEATHKQLTSTFNNLLILDGEKVPFFYLRNEFNVESDTAEVEQVVVVNYENKLVGLTVDAIVGEYQAVLKPLGKLYKKQDHISGATILGDGTIALVIDTNKMIKQFLMSEAVTI